MNRVLGSLGLLALVGVAAAPGCSGGFGEDPQTLRFEIKLADGTDFGSRELRKNIAVEPPDRYTVSVRALGGDGKTDTSFEGWLRVSSKPGNVISVTGNDVEGRNIHLRSGAIDNVTLEVSRAYGDTRIVVEDVGYTPVDPLRDPPPACADGKDNDSDGDIDFPADNECAFANDDSEEGGTYSSGASAPLFYKLPRAAEVRGFPSGAFTPFKAQTVSIDTGYREQSRDYDFTMVVTRLSSNGFYVADLEDDRPEAERTGFDGLFAFNFNTPSNLGYCDRLRRLSGTATEFFGSIQLGYPTWSATRWNPDEPCLIPEPYWFNAFELTAPNAITTKLKYTHSLVRARTGDQDAADGRRYRTSVRVSKLMGPEKPAANPDGSFRLSENATNCDFNGDDNIDFTTDPEKSCAKSCNDNVDCTEWSNFSTRANFQLVIESVLLENGEPKGDAEKVKIQGNGSTSTNFSALALRGQTIRSFSGTLGYFSGGDQFTIESRCADDIVTELDKEPIASSAACILRADVDNDNTQ